METYEALRRRASVREYEAKPVDKEDLRQLVEAARLAPTARGTEPWEFIVITDRDTLAEIADLAQNGSFIKGAFACIAVFCKETKYYLEDGCAATENILLAAADRGLGACWVAGDKKPYCDQIRGITKTPPGYKLVSLVSVGWPKGGVFSHKKRALDSVMHWERFGSST